MENKEIIRQLNLTASLMELHDENPFKLRSYNTAAFNLEKFQTPLEMLSAKELEEIEGVGKSMSAHIREIIEKGVYGKLDELLKVTPQGVIELLGLPGFGAKKIRSLWLDLGITNEKELMQACRDGKVAETKGFGAKSQAALIDAIEFLRRNRGKLQYARAEEVLQTITEKIADSVHSAEAVGEMRRKCEVITEIEILVTTDGPDKVRKSLESIDDLDHLEVISGPLSWKGIFKPTDTRVAVRFTDPNRFVSDLMLFTGSPRHLRMIEKDGRAITHVLRKEMFETEKEVYKRFDLPEIIPELREGLMEFALLKDGNYRELINNADLKGILHNHSTYSDGRHTLEDMASHCKELDYQYLGITDHSKSAFFARGMSEEKVAEQHREIESLNQKLAPFRIFKGIESDILFDGSLDYPDEILETFDFVIASIHMIMTMDEKKATERLIKAISNPYTTILGHPTGRLLLERDGYPIDHRAVIDACAEHNVVIELNANPHRLDLDWRWIPYAMEKDVMLSINPDAHRKAGYQHMHYGVLAARKGGLTKEMNLNSMTVDQIEGYFIKNRKNKVKMTAS